MCKLTYMFTFTNNIVHHIFEIIVESKVLHLLRCTIADSLNWNINFISARFNTNSGCTWKSERVHYLANFHWSRLKVLYLFSSFWILSPAIGWKKNVHSSTFFIHAVIKSKPVWLHNFIIHLVNLISIFICL